MHSPQPELAALAALADAVQLLVAAHGRTVRRGPEERLIVAADIIGFNDPRRDDEIQLALRHALHRLLDAALPDEDREDRGDGALLTLPADIPIPPLLSGVRAGLRLHNRLSSEPAQMRLRVAVHRGKVHRDEYGLAGRAVNHVFRLLDAPAFKALATTTDLAVIVSDPVYRTTLSRDPAYEPVIAALKETRAPAWVQLTPACLHALGPRPAEAPA